MNDLPGNDYAAVAKFRIEGVHEWQSEEGMTDATAIAKALDAQTQATLALAYEQRTANLIAHISLLAQASELDFDDDVQAANREILTRLGLNEGATK